LRASGALAAEGTEHQSAQVVDPVCGMTVSAGVDGLSLEHGGVTYYFCCPGCRDAFGEDPAKHAQRLLT
jgi:xanthine dehydrogenase accessory factor